jgi:predicted transcriptional regulator
VTGAENTQRGDKAKLTPEIVRLIRNSTETQAVLARRYGVGQPQISRIRNGHTWRAL